MNSDFSQLSAEERELRLTALLLGELPSAEAEQLHAALAADPELAREHARLQQTIALVRETSAMDRKTSAMDRKTSADGTPLRLDDKRREKLLATFKTPAPRAVAPRRPRNFSYVPLSIAAVLVGLLALVAALPMFVKSRASLQLAERATPLPGYGTGPDKTVTYFGSSHLAEKAVRRSGRMETKGVTQLESEVLLADNFDVLGFTAEPTPAKLSKPASKSLASVALAMPAVNDTDGDTRVQVSGQLQSLSDFTGEQLLTGGLQNESKRPSVVRALIRADDYALASGGSIDSTKSAANPVPARGDSSLLSAPSITTMSGRQVTIPVPGVNYAITDLETSSTVPQASDPAVLAKNLDLGETKMLGSIVAANGAAPSSAPVAPPVASGGFDSDRTVRSANVANFYADVALVPESQVEQKGRFDSGGFAGGGGSVTFQNQGAVHTGGDSFSVLPTAPSANAPKQDMTVADAQPIIQRRRQIQLSAPATPGSLPPTALGLDTNAAKLVQDGKLYYETGRAKEADESLRQALKSDPENKSAAYYLDLVNAKSYSEEARVREINSKQLLMEVEQAWSEPGARSTPPVSQLSDLNRNATVGLGFNSQVDPAWAKDRAGVSAGAAPELETRSFRVDANTLESGLRNVTALSFGESLNGGSGGGGGGRGGGGRNSGRNPAQPQSSDGLQFVTESTPASALVPTVQNFLATAGVDLKTPGKSVEYDDRNGTLTVRGTAADLDRVQKSMQVLNMTEPQLTVRAKFMNIESIDAEALALAPQSGDKTLQDGFGGQANSTPAPEGMVDALEAIRKTPSNAGGAGVSTRGESPNNYFRSRMLLEPSSGGRVSVTRSPAPEPVKEAVRFTDDGAALYVNGIGVASTNALVSNHYWEMNANSSAADKGAAWFGNTAQGNVQWDFIAPISEGEKSASPVEGRFKTTGDSSGLNYQWRMADAGIAKDQPVGGVDGRLGGSGPRTGRRMNSVVNRAGEVVVSDPVANTSPMTREFFADDFDVVPTSERGRAAGDVNGRVTVQLPALAGEAQLSRQSSPTRPANVRQSELALEGGDAVVAQSAPVKAASVAMTGITTLISEAAGRLEARGQVVFVEEAKKPAASGMQLNFASIGSAPTFTNAIHAATSGKVSATNVATGGAIAKARLQDNVSEVARPKPSTNSPKPQPEVLTRDNAFSTFSLNVSDVSFKLAAASLEKGAMPDVATVRSEEFINAFDYRDPVPAAGVPLAFISERARYPFAHNRDVLRFSVKTAAQGRDGGRPLNIVLLLDNSGSMERADRVRIIQEALRALAAQLQPQDKLSVVTFSRTARLWADGVTGAQAAEVAGKIAALTPEGGTNLEEALDLAYRTALRHYAATAMNRVVLLTDGAANLGNVEPAALKAKVENFRKQGVALDCFGIGWEGFNDDLLEQLSRNGDGRYGFVNTPEEASTEFAAQLAGALQVAASDVKVQVEFNPKRVTAYRQIGYAKHQLTKQQFRDNTVDAAEISASEAGNALYVIETNPRGEGPVATVRARFRIPQTSDYREHEWVVPFGSAVELEQSSSALRLATSASAFSEWLAGSPFAGEVTTDRLLGLLSGVPEVYGADPRPKKLEWMIRQAKSISGK